MEDQIIIEPPLALNKIIEESKLLGFNMASEEKTGAFLSALAASKPGGNFLEIGTGTGLSTAWILQGMDKQSSLLSIDNDARTQQIAIANLDDDPRFQAVCCEGEEWLEKNQAKHYDFIFADAWPGKFSHLQLALNILNKGGMYIIDDLLPQENWPKGHAPRVPKLIEKIEGMAGFLSVRIKWASGLMLVVKNV